MSLPHSAALPPVIAIDGPSGVGKGTVARALATRLGWHFLDSGALYRILGLAAQRAGVAIDDPAAVAGLAPGLVIRFAAEGPERIEVNGADWTAAVRAEATGALASAIAVHPPVREALLERQRVFRRSPGLVADGRDMGTVVFADAAVKVFLDATAEERARRRQKQLSEQGIAAKLPALFADIRARDIRDRSRSHSPLKPADDAVVIDTTELPPDAVLAQIEGLLKAKGCAT
ncbi:MAG TPA: (d)CMP kinase [Candidatus Binatia bacterium]|nr:(d)CMP kinase [Candidatus Binatia bacterium]